MMSGKKPVMSTITVKQSQRRRAIKGKGDYTTEVLSERVPLTRLEKKIDHLEKALVGTKPNVRGAASGVGRILGNFVNQGDLGAAAGGALAKLFGHGDYDIKSNSLVKSSSPNGPPPLFVSKDGKRGTRFVEREFLFDVTAGALVSGATAFTNVSLSLNPTDVTTFPWLASIAAQFDQWEPNGIVFEFVSTSSEFSATQALGTVIMSTDYDPTDLPYSSKAEMENADYACSSKPSSCLLHGIECDPSERPLKVMFSSSPTPAFQSLGNFQVATVGCTAAGVKLGELWISYDITLYKKQITQSPSIYPVWNASGTSAIGAPFWQTVTSLYQEKSIHFSMIVGVGPRFTFPINQSSGRYILTTYSSVSEVATISFTNSVLVSALPAAPGTMRVVSFDITAPGAYFTVTNLAVAASIWTVFLYQIPNSSIL